MMQHPQPSPPRVDLAKSEAPARHAGSLRVARKGWWRLLARRWTRACRAVSQQGDAWPACATRALARAGAAFFVPYIGFDWTGDKGSIMHSPLI